MNGDDLGFRNETIQAIELAQPQLGSNPRETDLTQLFIKAPEGKSYCLRLWKGSGIQELRNEIQNLLGILEQGQNLISRGRSLQDNHTFQEYNITIDSTIIINFRLRGGYSGTSSKNTGSFKDAVNGKGKAQVNPATNPVLPRPYIVEQNLRILLSPLKCPR